ncbi:hypothetical protein BGZ59_009278 [Podila verticillata]|nr:hypothetical protein BGZ59_009278 [Podila verticillata]
MDGINFQGMSRIALTSTEEALVPRPPSSASQVAPALPSTYTRFGSSHSLASAPSTYSLSRPLNSPARPSQPYPSSSTAPTSPHGEQEYPQNPQDSYYSHSPAVSLRRGSQSHGTPVHQAHQDSWGSARIESPTPMTESDDSDGDDDGEISRDTDSSKERPSRPHPHHPHHPHHNPRRSADLLRRLKQSTKLTFGVEEGSHRSSPANNTNLNNTYISSHHPHRPQYSRSLDLHMQQQSQDSPSGSRRTSREYSDEERPFPLAPLHHPEPRRSRSAWRPSLSLIRQESSIHGQYPSIHGQYPQHDTRPLDNASAINQMPILEESPTKRHRTKPKKAPKKDKKRKPTKIKKLDKKPKDRPLDIPEKPKNVLTMPNLQQVLEKKTSFPLGYDDLEAFLRTQRAAEYLNFWADVTAHEQLCRTFDVSERRQMRELQLEERAIARDKRRVALLQYEAHHSSDHMDQGQDLNNSNLYLTSRSSLQLPLTDHLSFPAESRRYGLQDATPAYAPPTRRQTFDHPSSGAYNRLLAGTESGIQGRRSSMDRARTSMDRHGSAPFSHQPHFGPPSLSTPTSYNQMMRKRGSTDILAGAKASAEEHRTGDLRRSTSQQMSNEPHPNTLDEIAKLTQAVEESIQLSLASDPGAPSLSVLDPTLFRKPSSTFEQGLGPLQAPLVIRRSIDKPTFTVPQEPKMLLVQSYRTIGLEDVQESALRIYRRFLIQLRTASMAAEEAASSSKGATSAPGLPRGSVDGVGSRWDGYAEQVIAEWNEKWRDCGPEARRLRRLSGRKSVSERGDGDHHDGDIKDEKHQGSMGSGAGSDQGLTEEQIAREEALAKRRSGTGFTAFLNRLLRTETTILELPTLTVNTTTVEETAVSDVSDDSGDEEEDYDSDIDDDDEEEEEEAEPQVTRKDTTVPPEKDSEIELQAVITAQTTIRLKEAETIGGSTAAESRRSSLSVSRSSCDHTSEQEEHKAMTLPWPVTAGPIRKSSINKRDQTRGIRSKTGKVTPVASKVAKSGSLSISKQGRRTSVSSMDTLNPLGSPRFEQSSFLASLNAVGSNILTGRDKEVGSRQELDLEKGMGNGLNSHPQRLSSSSLPSPSHPSYPNSPMSSSPTPSSSAPQPQLPLSGPVGDTVGANAGTAFYLPLECRQRIHTQVLEEFRTEAPHLFGPAKGFVVEIVLRDHYYPLFLEHVQQQNLGLSSQYHVNIIRKRIMLGVGIALWVLVVAAQVTFVLVGLGGWTSPWLWMVGVLGWIGSICLATGIVGFSPILGLVGQIAEDRHVWRFRKIVDPSIRTLHFRRSVWMLTYCAFWSSVVMVIIAALPEKK